jgi:hypothetical protein
MTAQQLKEKAARLMADANAVIDYWTAILPELDIPSTRELRQWVGLFDLEFHS